MTELTAAHFIGIFATLILITGIGIWSGKRVKSASDFSTGGGKTGPVLVAGTIMGTLVGGSSTIATAQLAFTFGLSAWWYTLGAGIACLFMAVFFVSPLRHSGSGTLTGIVSREYGLRCGVTASVLSSVGIFINIISQLISGTAVISIAFPELSAPIILLFTAALMTLYVIFGGVWGTGLAGVVKLALLYLSVVVGAWIVLRQCGIASLYHNPVLPQAQFFNLFARGVGTDGGACLSLLLGVVSTQIYAQACMAGRSDRAAKQGALISTFMIPPIGAGGILIGLYMRVNYPQLTSAKLAFPQFVLDHLPPLIGGVVLATLLIAVVGTGAGLALGVSTILHNDIAKRVTPKLVSTSGSSLLFSRFAIVAVLALACILADGALGDLILNFSFMSMGLRAAVIFTPLCGALFFPGRINPGFALAAIIAGPLTVLLGNFMKLSFDPLFLGMAAAALIMAAGLLLGRKTKILK